MPPIWCLAICSESPGTHQLEEAKKYYNRQVQDGTQVADALALKAR